MDHCTERVDELSIVADTFDSQASLMDRISENDNSTAATTTTAGCRRKGVPPPLILRRKLTFLDIDPRRTSSKKVVKRRASIFGGMLGTWKVKGTKKAGTPNSLDRTEVQRLMKRTSMSSLSLSPALSGEVSGILDDTSYLSLTGWSPAPNSTTFPQLPLKVAEAGFSAANPFVTPPRTPLTPLTDNESRVESPGSPDSFFDIPPGRKIQRRSGLKTLQILGHEAKDAVAAKYDLAL